MPSPRPTTTRRSLPRVERNRYADLLRVVTIRAVVVHGWTGWVWHPGCCARPPEVSNGARPAHVQGADATGVPGDHVAPADLTEPVSAAPALGRPGRRRVRLMAPGLGMAAFAPVHRPAGRPGYGSGSSRSSRTFYQAACLPPLPPRAGCLIEDDQRGHVARPVAGHGAFACQPERAHPVPQDGWPRSSPSPAWSAAVPSTSRYRCRGGTRATQPQAGWRWPLSGLVW